jgi:hypothetical protein
MKTLAPNLKRLSARAQTVHALGANPHYATELAGFMDEIMASNVTDAELAEKVRKSWDDPAVKREMCEVRVETYTNFIRANSTFLPTFFQEVVLGPADRPAIQNATKNEISIGYVSQDGRPRAMKAINPTTETLIDLRVRASDVVGYFLQDLYNGNVGQVAQATFDIPWDLANKLDADAYALLTASLSDGGVFGAFTTTGTRQNRVYVPHSRIVTANLPSTNDIVLDQSNYQAWNALKYNAGAGTNSDTTSGRFRLDVIRAIMTYCDRWGNVFPEPIRPTGMIIVPSVDCTQLATEITPTGTFYNKVAEGLLTNYHQFSYMGVNWVLVPDSTIATGTCYPVLNKPVGRFYTKPSMDTENVETFKAKNWEERFATKVVGMAIPSPNRVNAVRVTYHT